MPEEEQPEKYTPGGWERITAIITAVFVIVCVSYLVIRNEPFADQYLATLARTLLSFAMAVLGVTTPGFLNIGLNIKGLSVRAAGALVFFALTFAFMPRLLELSAKGSAMIDIVSAEFGAATIWLDYTDQIAAECDDKNQCAPTLVLNPSDSRFPEFARALNKALIIKHSCDQGDVQSSRMNVAEEGPITIQIICDN